MAQQDMGGPGSLKTTAPLGNNSSSYVCVGLPDTTVCAQLDSTALEQPVGGA